MSRTLKSSHGLLAGLDSSDRLIIPAVLRSGEHGNQFDYTSPSRVVFHRDFVGGNLAFATPVTEGLRR
jgi:hypothetical protein